MAYSIYMWKDLHASYATNVFLDIDISTLLLALLFLCSLGMKNPEFQCYQ